MRSLTKTEAIILRKRELLENDLVIIIFTEELGVVRTIAKGAKKITSRRSPHLDTGNLINVYLSHSRESYYLDNTQLISGFTSIKSDQRKISYLYAFFFILDRIMPQEQPDSEVYNLTKKYLVDLAKHDFTSQIFQTYLQTLLFTLGYIEGELPLSSLINRTQEIINEKIPLDDIM